MLILTRRVGETIRIGDDVQFVILGTRGGYVRVGIDAPRDVNIAREELLTRTASRREPSRSDRDPPG